MIPCKSCPILFSCQRKHDHPKDCTHKPYHIGTNLSNAFANLGKRGIAISSGGHEDMMRIGNEEHMLRLETCGKCP